MVNPKQRAPKGAVDIHVDVISIPARGAVNRIVGIAASDKEEFRIRFNKWLETEIDAAGLPETTRAICVDPGIPTWIESCVPGMSLSAAAGGACEVLRSMGYAPQIKPAIGPSRAIR